MVISANAHNAKMDIIMAKESVIIVKQVAKHAHPQPIVLLAYLAPIYSHQIDANLSQLIVLESISKASVFNVVMDT
jgi:tryptophan synthase alpha subunit